MRLRDREHQLEYGVGGGQFAALHTDVKVEARTDAVEKLVATEVASLSDQSAEKPVGNADRACHCGTWNLGLKQDAHSGQPGYMPDDPSEHADGRLAELIERAKRRGEVAPTELVVEWVHGLLGERKHDLGKPIRVNRRTGRVRAKLPRLLRQRQQAVTPKDQLANGTRREFDVLLCEDLLGRFGKVIGSPRRRETVNRSLLRHGLEDGTRCFQILGEQGYEGAGCRSLLENLDPRLGCSRALHAPNDEMPGEAEQGLRSKLHVERGDVHVVCESHMTLDVWVVGADCVVSDAESTFAAVRVTDKKGNHRIVHERLRERPW